MLPVSRLYLTLVTESAHQRIGGRPTQPYNGYPAPKPGLTHPGLRCGAEEPKPKWRPRSSSEPDAAASRMPAFLTLVVLVFPALPALAEPKVTQRVWMEVRQTPASKNAQQRDGAVRVGGRDDNERPAERDADRRLDRLLLGQTARRDEARLGVFHEGARAAAWAPTSSATARR